jgi:hypothetical protein
MESQIRGDTREELLHQVRRETPYLPEIIEYRNHHEKFGYSAER